MPRSLQLLPGSLLPSWAVYVDSGGGCTSAFPNGDTSRSGCLSSLRWRMR